MKIGVVGCGYVGFGVVVNMTVKGHQCICYDINKQKIENLKNKQLPFYEKDFEEVYNKNHHLMTFVDDLKVVIDECDVIYFAINTPANEQGRCDISNLQNAIMSANQYVTTNKLFIIKSTSEVGTTDNFKTVLNPKVSLVFSPEFLAQGELVHNTIYPQRLVFGLDKNDAFARKLLDEIYQKEMINNIQVIYTDYKTAELAKYACNTFLAMRVSFINNISQLCEKLNADIGTIETVMKLDDRIGSKYLSSGLGFGGSCFPKDIEALKFIANTNGVDCSLIDNIKQINFAQTEYAVSQIKEYSSNNKILVLGTTFKKDTSDITNSPSLRLISSLLENNFEVYVYDLVKVDLSRYKDKDKITRVEDFDKAVNDFDNIVIASDWNEFKKLKEFKFASHKNIFDYKKLLEKVSIDNCTIYSIGKSK